MSRSSLVVLPCLIARRSWEEILIIEYFRLSQKAQNFVSLTDSTETFCLFRLTHGVCLGAATKSPSKTPKSPNKCNPSISQPPKPCSMPPTPLTSPSGSPTAPSCSSITASHSSTISMRAHALSSYSSRIKSAPSATSVSSKLTVYLFFFRAFPYGSGYTGVPCFAPLHVPPIPNAIYTFFPKSSQKICIYHKFCVILQPISWQVRSKSVKNDTKKCPPQKWGGVNYWYTVSYKITIFINSNFKRMKHYNQPETNVLQVINSSIVCASAGPGLAPAASLESVEKTNGAW